MAFEATFREDYAHPERIYPNLIFGPNNGRPVDIDAKEAYEGRKNSLSRDKDLRKEELCWFCGWSCGWTAYQELTSSYGSRIRIFHARDNRGTWDVGSRWMIRDQPNDDTKGNDFITQEFLRNHKPSLDIPLLKEMKKLSAPEDPVDITLMSRFQGEQLDMMWRTLTRKQKNSYQLQLGNAIKSWRQCTSPVPGKVDGSVMSDWLLGCCYRYNQRCCMNIGRTTDEWFSILEEGLKIGLSGIHKTKDPLVIEEEFQKLKKNFPKPEPYVPTHGDLLLKNIIVKDEKIEAIVGWEVSGYMPWWVERYASIMVVDGDNKPLLRPIWEDIDKEMDEATFEREVIRG